MIIFSKVIEEFMDVIIDTLLLCHVMHPISILGVLLGVIMVCIGGLFVINMLFYNYLILPMSEPIALSSDKCYFYAHYFIFYQAMTIYSIIVV